VTRLRYRAGDLREVARAVIEAFGSSADEAAVVADHMVGANLKGHDSHGVGLLASYDADLAAGSLVPNARPQTLLDAGPLLQIDARFGFGQRVGREAVDAAISRARAHGVALLTLRHAHHLGRIGTYGEQAAAAGLVSVHFVNVLGVTPLVAPFGGAQARFGTDPVCIALPGEHDTAPVVMDWATSMVAYGKARVAYHDGSVFPEPVLVSADGVPTADPSVMFTDPPGALLPFGSHKGGGMLFVTELLAGILSGGGTLADDNVPRGLVNNMVSIVIDPRTLGDAGWQSAQLRDMIAYATSARPAVAGRPILVPGEIERQREADRLARGIEIGDEEWAGIRDAGRAHGVPESVFDVAGEHATA